MLSKEHELKKKGEDSALMGVLVEASHKIQLERLEAAEGSKTDFKPSTHFINKLSAEKKEHERHVAVHEYDEVVSAWSELKDVCSVREKALGREVRVAVLQAGGRKGRRRRRCGVSGVSSRALL